MAYLDKDGLEYFWEKLSAMEFRNRGSFTGATLTNNNLEPGIYWCNLASVSGGPESSGYGWLIVYPNGNYQEFVLSGTYLIYSRGYVNAAWGAWVCTGGSDSVVASGTSGGWNYIKYSSGIALCWGSRNFSGCVVNQAWGSLYKDNGSTVEPRSYPFPFASAPDEFGGIHGNNSSLMLLGTVANTATTSVGYVIARPTSATVSGTAWFLAIGRWK